MTRTAKPLLMAIALLACAKANACLETMAGQYAHAGDKSTSRQATLRLVWQQNQLQAYTLDDQRQWLLQPQAPQPFAQSQFEAFTKTQAGPDYCGLSVLGVILARVPQPWHWAGFRVDTGYALITLGGAHPMQRLPLREPPSNRKR